MTPPTSDETERPTSALTVPDDFLKWAERIPRNARVRLSIHELRQIWEPMHALQAENERQRRRIAELKTYLRGVAHQIEQVVRCDDE